MTTEAAVSHDRHLAEEPRHLSWDHVDLDGRSDTTPPVPPSVMVWRTGGQH